MLNYLKKLLLGRRCYENYDFIGKVAIEEKTKIVSIFITYRKKEVAEFFWFTGTKTVYYRDIPTIHGKGVTLIPEDIMAVGLELISKYFYHQKIYDPIIDTSSLMSIDDCPLIKLLTAATRPSSNLMNALCKCSTFTGRAFQYILHSNVDVSLVHHDEVLIHLPLVYYIEPKAKLYYVVSDKKKPKLTKGKKEVLYPEPVLAVRAFMNQYLKVNDVLPDKLYIYKTETELDSEVSEIFGTIDSHLTAPVRTNALVALIFDSERAINKNEPMLRMRAYGNSLIYNHSPLYPINS